MIVDVAVFLLSLLAIYKGWRKGLVLAIFSVLAFIVGLAAALKFSVAVASWLGEQTSIGERWLPFIAFILVFVIVALLVRLAARAIEKLLNLAMMGWANKLAGILFYLFLYCIIISILLFYAVELKVVKTDTMQSSVTYESIRPLGPFVINQLAVILPFFRNMFDKLELFFGNLS